MKFLKWQNPEQLFVAQELINKVKSKCCGIKEIFYELVLKFCEEHNVLIGSMLECNNKSIYPMMSVFKVHQALALCNDFDKKGLSLDTLVKI